MNGRALPTSNQTITARSALLFSDVHLSEATPALTQALIEWLHRHCIASDRRPDQLLILGDLFDAWVGDDQQQHPQAGACARVVSEALCEIRSQGISIRFMAGNRDFLVGEAFLRPFDGLRMLDPSLLVIEEGLTIAISHGDQLCTLDTDYQQFRAQVRAPEWQRNFLAQPLAKRLAIAQNIRAQSETEKSGKTMTIMDITPQAAVTLTDQLAADVLLHGHTHRPGQTTMPNGKVRWVLSDWEMDTQGGLPRGGGLWVDQRGVSLRPL